MQKFDLNDIALIPAIISDIKSRKDINIYDENNMLHLFTAPMFDVIDKQNYKNYLNNNVYTIIPRKSKYYLIDYSIDSKVFIAYGLEDIKKLFINNKDFYLEYLKIYKDHKFYILIDIANGHMKYLLDLIKELKDIYESRIVIMAGNIANPKTYELYCKYNIDYVRLGVGTGSACLTTSNTAIYYPMGSLLAEINEIKKDYKFNKKFTTKVIIDGGIKGYSDIIKSYALGADYIILGSVFNKALESSGLTFIKSKDKDIKNILKINDKTEYKNYIKTKEDNYIIDQYSNIAEILFNNNITIYKEYRGMSTKEIQKELNRKELRTSEGITKTNKVEYLLNKWLENYKDYLKSSMSYMGYKNINDMIGNGKFINLTENAYLRHNK